MIRRKKMTLFLDAKETTQVNELKKMIEGVTKVPPNKQRVYNREDTVRDICTKEGTSINAHLTHLSLSLSEQIMEDDKTLADYGLTSTMAKAQSPAEVGLAFMVDGTWEELVSGKQRQKN